jgi:hypothetical protein
MNNNDDKFLGRPVQFNAVGRIAEGTDDKVVRPVKMSSAYNTRLIIGIVVLIVLAISVFVASESNIGITHTGGSRHNSLQEKPTAGSNF